MRVKLFAQNPYFCNMEQQPNNPLHGVTLEYIVKELVAHFGWERLSYYVDIRCFKDNPSVQSSLKFLRKTPWARQKVEDLYVSLVSRKH
jgi:uncharacterized protein (DUF2132 family)